MREHDSCDDHVCDIVYGHPKLRGIRGGGIGTLPSHGESEDAPGEDGKGELEEVK